MRKSGKTSIIGKTSIMLHRAVADALEGERVMVVAATHKQARQMFQRVADMQTPKGHNSLTLYLEYGETGRIQFIANSNNREGERGWTGKIVTDHYVLETIRRF